MKRSTQGVNLKELLSAIQAFYKNSFLPHWRSSKGWLSKVRIYYQRSFLYQYWVIFPYFFSWRKKRKPGDVAMSWIWSLDTLDQESQEKLQSASHYDRQQDISMILSWASSFCYSILRIVVIVTSYFTAPIIVQYWLQLPSQPFTSSYFWNFVFFIFLGLFPLAIRGIFLNLFHIDLINLAIRLGRWPQLFFICYVGILILFRVLSYEHIPYPSQYATPILGAIVTMLGLYFITWLRSIYSQWYESYLFDYYVMSLLVSLLSNVRNYYHEHLLSEARYKHDQVSNLEGIAQMIERSLSPRSLWLDTATKAWYKKRTQQIANAFRDRKKLILIPSKDAEKYFSEKIKAAFVCILNSDWDALEQKELELSPQVSHSWRSTVGSWLRGFALAILPIAAFLILQQTQWAIVAPIRDYVIAGLFIWALLSVMAVIDPAIGSRIAAFKDATSLSNLVSDPTKRNNP